MNKTTFADIMYIVRMFFGVSFLFSYLFATEYRTGIVLVSLALWIISAIIYKIVK